MKTLLIISCFFLSGCMGTENYYAAQTAYYNAQAQANTAYITAINNRPPIAEMISPDGTKFIVNQTQAIPMPVISTIKNPIVESLKTIMNATPVAILAGGWSAKQIIKSSTGDINNESGTVTSTANSNNQTELNNADESISRDESATDDNSVMDSHDAVSDPVIVTQPEPIVINPVIVDPVVISSAGDN